MLENKYSVYSLWRDLTFRLNRKRRLCKMFGEIVMAMECVQNIWTWSDQSRDLLKATVSEHQYSSTHDRETHPTPFLLYLRPFSKAK